jgi:Rrf2 family iron-sulfur cluster assembly transcriptional regulator
MRITTKGRYALKAILYLAKNHQDQPISIKSIAASEKISPEFLEQLFFKLKKSEVIASVRGPGGGFFITKDLSEITVQQVFEAVGETLDLTPCTTCNEDTDPCDATDDCLSYDVWKTAADHIRGYFGNLSLKKILDGGAKEFWNADIEEVAQG